MTGDFDLHGLLRLRVCDAPPAAMASVCREVGLDPTPPAGDPDLQVRFVGELELSGPLRHVGLTEGFTDDAYLVKNEVGALTRLPFEALGGRAEISCEYEVGHVPYIVSILNLTALGKGLLPLHASAVRYHGRDVLLTGWAKGGKTEATLALVARGAAFVADEIAYLDTATGTVTGLHYPVRVWDWMLQQLPSVRRRLRARQRARLAAVGVLRRSVPGAFGGRLGPAVRTALAAAHGVDIPPAQLFDREHVLASCRPEILLHLEAWDNDTIVAEPVDGMCVAARMVPSLQAEREDLEAAYRRFRFAFPERRCEALDTAPEREAGLLRRGLGDLPAYRVCHPYPVDLKELAIVIDSLLGDH